MKVKYRIFDLETDGLLDSVSKVHVMAVRDFGTKEVRVFREDNIHEGVELLQEPGVVAVAHNGIGFDFEVLRLLYGAQFEWQQVLDTMVLSRLVWAELKFIDLDRREKGTDNGMPGRLLGSHSLEAWGYRLGEHKGDYKGDPELVHKLIVDGWPAQDAVDEAYRLRWSAWNQDMEDYCVQDVAVTHALLERILSKAPDQRAVALETQTATIVARQERHGILFNTAKAAELQVKLLARKLELDAEVKKVFRPRFLRDGKVFTPKVDSKKHGYCAGAPMTKVKLTEFNPTSRDHVSTWLIRDFGWEPVEFTQEGKPKVDDEIIAALPYPEARPLKEYFMVAKRLGQLAEGDEAWLKHVGSDGRIHGRVNTNGAVTGRMTHSSPNMAQVPASRSPYGHECRELFGVPKGKKQVGADADALELRCLASRMALYDGGEYVRFVLEGEKSKGTDTHSVNCRALGMDPKEKQWDGQPGRDVAKTWFYAFIYGAGDEKLGTIRFGTKDKKARKQGRQMREQFLANLPAMGKLVAKVRQVVKQRGYLVGLDGRHLKVRSEHAALNTLLQSDGALIMKKALCILDESLKGNGLVCGKHYEFIANVHDEWQLEVDDGIEELVGGLAVQAIRDAGKALGLRCPLDGEYKTGANWADTH